MMVELARTALRGLAIPTQLSRSHERRPKQTDVGQLGTVHILCESEECNDASTETFDGKESFRDSQQRRQ